MHIGQHQALLHHRENSWYSFLNCRFQLRFRLRFMQDLQAKAQIRIAIVPPATKFYSYRQVIQNFLMIFPYRNRKKEEQQTVKCQNSSTWGQRIYQYHPSIYVFKYYSSIFINFKLYISLHCNLHLSLQYFQHSNKIISHFNGYNFFGKRIAIM